ncbi:Gldg family protein [Pseudobacter ginsenosidimutans]|uniref:ABC-2 type transport system permease protein n=1 Tax=Pseudobacter ginsenosidimutans TaxID=661488 RepID=A0A4Q7MVB5_9BACT|nr:Gldg family protein [Pseudobacter ginsenosidimutans]QEC40671.1 ABC transporter permease subunit [Pseudobacter ginsenosidimutans]RZS72607.1 ABC-2 type transport system permease protein [Pseudobacter ginsenosidimutans]
MRSIYRIGRQELSILFHSPVAWLILIVFPIQIGMDFAEYILMLGRSQRMGTSFQQVTNIVFASQNGFYVGVKNTLYFYIPLLTMGLISRELHSGSIKLLLSSPVKVRDIVLGKYLSMMVYGLILVAIIGMYGFAGSFFIGNIDYLMVISGAFGLYLLICAYAAIGLFMSSLTSYQVVAAISTLAVLALLNFVGGLFQGNDVIRHVTYFLSISGRTEQFISGLISSEDVIYFLLIITFFLSITGMRLQAGREAKSVRLKITRYAVLIAGCVIIGYISSRPRTTGYIDMTVSKSRTLGEKSVAFLKQMDKPLRITTYVNVLGDNFYLGAPEKKSFDERLFNQYRRYIPDLQMDYVYYYDMADNKNLLKSNRGSSIEEIAKKVADIQKMDFKKLLGPAEIRKIVDLAPEQNRIVRQLEYGNRKTFLRYYEDIMTYPSEQEITAAIKRLMEPEKIPVIRFVTGHDERSAFRSGDADLRKSAAELSFRYSLINQGFDIDTLNLINDNIPAGTSALVLADPKNAYTEAELQKIKAHIDAGGNMMILSETTSQAFLDPVCEYIGVKTGTENIMQQSKDYAPDLVQALFTQDTDAFSDRYKMMRADSAIITMPGVSTVSYMEQSFKAIPLLKSWNEKNLAAALHRKISNKEQKIIVVADADFLSTTELSRRNPENSNFGLVTGIYSWFSDGEFPVNTQRKRSKDVIDSTDDGVMMLRLFFFGLLPACFLIAGATLLIYRKRR